MCAGTLTTLLTNTMLLRDSTPAALQEPHFFTANGGCTHPNSSAAWGCDQQAQQTYLLDIMHRDEVANSGLMRAAFEASVHYAMVSEWAAAVVAACQHAPSISPSTAAQ